MPPAARATERDEALTLAGERRLVFLGTVAALLFAALYVVAVRSGWGQRLDGAALEGRTHRAPVLTATGHLLDTISVSSLVLLGGAVVAVAFARRRVHLAFTSAAVVVGAVATSELLKRVLLGRPDLDYTDTLRHKPTFPSGHTTVAMSLAVALVLVVPARSRPLTALVTVGYACMVGAGTVTAGWHRPSDVIGGMLVVLTWAAAATLVLLRQRGATPEREPALRVERLVDPVFAWTGAVLLGIGFVGFVIVFVALRQDRLAAVRLNGAYAAALAAIVGSALVLMAAFLTALRGTGLDRGGTVSASAVEQHP